MEQHLFQQQPSRAAASRVHPYAKSQAYARPHDGAWWPLALFQYWHAAASPPLGTAPYGAWSCGVPPPPLPSWFSSYYTIPAPSRGHQQRASTHARPSTVVVDYSQARRQAVPAPADRQVAVPAPPAEPKHASRAEIQAATDAADRFLEHDLDLTALAKRLQRASKPPTDMDLALREYRRFLILKVMHRDERATLLSPSSHIDQVWHAHVLDTQAYTAMNEQLPIYIHHDPNGACDEDAANRARRLDNTRTCYRARWGDLPAAMWDDSVPARPACRDTRAPSPAPVQHLAAADDDGTMEVVLISFDATKPMYRVRVSESMRVQVVAAAFAARFSEDMSKLRLSDAGARLDLSRTFAECEYHADEGPHVIDVAYEQVGC